MIGRGDVVVVIRPEHPDYGRVGTVTGRRDHGLGVVFLGSDLGLDTIAESALARASDFDAVRARMAGLDIRDARAVRDLRVMLPGEARHLILTGPNGSGKSTVLAALYDRLRAECGRGGPPAAEDAEVWVDWDVPYHAARAAHHQHLPLLVYVRPVRRWEVQPVTGPSEIKWNELRDREFVAGLWMQHLVNQRAALSFAREEGDSAAASALESWLDELEPKLRGLLGRPDLEMVFDRQAFRYRFRLAGREVELSHLPDGFASLLSVWAEIALREEAHRRANGRPPQTGYVLIDEVETHLHLKLQETVLGVLTAWFPRYQFIVTTHAAPVLPSIADALVVDLGSRVQVVSADLRGIPYGDLMMGHFGIPSDLDVDTTALRERFQAAIREGRRAEAEELGARLGSRSSTLALEVWSALREGAA